MYNLCKVEVKRVLYTFIFPAKYSEQNCRTAIRSIRVGYHRAWERIFINSTIEITVEKKEGLPDITEHMKYFILCDEEDEKLATRKEMFIFSKNIDHDRMCEGARHMVYDHDAEQLGAKGKLMFHVSGAGFIYSDGNCRGRSETLDVNSDPSDSELFKNSLIFATERNETPA